MMVEFEWYSTYAMKAFGNDNDTMIFQTLAELEATEDMIKGMEPVWILEIWAKLSNIPSHRSRDVTRRVQSQELVPAFYANPRGIDEMPGHM
jgi:hypothetical protein